MQRSPLQDHRPRTAKLRRERTQAKLLNAAMECYARTRSGEPLTVDAIVARADVSRPTFYKYFQSVDEIIERRADELVEDMIKSLQKMVRHNKKPAFLFVVSLRLFLLRSISDPVWASFVARSDMLAAKGELFRGMTLHLDLACDEGEFAFPDREAAVVVVVGALREAIRSIATRRHTPVEFIDGIVRMVLVSLGASRTSVEDLLLQTQCFIDRAAPERLDWWQP